MRKLKKRLKDFARYYAEPGSDTHNNAYRSAIKAGYAERYAFGNSYKLVEKNGVREIIAEIEKNIEEQARKTAKEKAKIAWQNYLEARSKGRDRDAQKWFREHGELQGDYIVKQEITAENTLRIKETEAQEIARISREARKEALQNSN